MNQRDLSEICVMKNQEDRGRRVIISNGDVFKYILLIICMSVEEK